MIRDVITAKSIRAALGYLAMPPGWQPDGKGETTEDLRRHAHANAEPRRAPEAVPQAGSAYGD